MTNITNFQDILGAANGDKASVLGKFLYFSLANILVEKEALAQLCEDLSIPYSGSKRISVSDAFRSATGDIKAGSRSKAPVRIISTRSTAATMHTLRTYIPVSWSRKRSTSGRISMKSWQTSFTTGAIIGLGLTTLASTLTLIPSAIAAGRRSCLSFIKRARTADRSRRSA